MRHTLLLLLTLIMLGCGQTKKNSQAKHSYTIEHKDGSIDEVPIDLIDNFSPLEYDKLIKYLTAISGQKIDKDKKIVINYIDNDIDKLNYQVPWDIFYGDMNNELDQIEDGYHFWIINKDLKNRHYYHGDKINWIDDKDGFINDTFFGYDRLNGGFAIILPNGKYYRKVGEYTKADVLKTYMVFD